jgi:peptidoglycan/LPS O-acetylase OafA/YrhL
MTAVASTRDSQRLPSLTGMRFFAALIVFGFHLSLNKLFTDDTDVSSPFAALMRNGGWFGVSFFFVLSGFVLTWSVRPKDRAKDFIARRLVKIYPNHLVTFVISFALFGLAGATAAEALGNLTLLHAWIPRDTSFFSINHPSWSLSAELFFYAAFPLLWMGVRRIPARVLWPVAILVMLAVLALPTLAALLPAGEVFGPNHKNSPLYQHSMTQVWFVYAFPLTRLLDFLLGMLMATIVRNGRWPRLHPGAALALVVASYAVSLALPLPYQMNAAFIIPIALVIPAIAAHESRGRSGWLSHPKVVFLGEISFAFYMVHDIFLTGVGTVLAGRTLPVGAGIALGLGVLLASCAAAWALYALVERPLTRWWSRRNRPAAVSTDNTTPAKITEPSHV